MKNTAPLLNVQYGLYVACAEHTGEAFYNLPYLYLLDPALDAERLRQAVETAVKNHPTLFTRLALNDEGEPVQTLDTDQEKWQLEIEDLPAATESDVEKRFAYLIEPFDIIGGRLFHIRLLRDREHLYLFLDIHHIIGDGTTLQVMLSDIDRAYKGETLQAEELSLAELAKEEADKRQSSVFDEAKQWYAQHFDCGDTYTPLLPDLEIAEHSENHLTRTLEIDMQAVDDFCKQNGVFRSNFFTAAYALLLAKYNNEQESLFTTIYNGRSDKRFARSVGMTVKTLPVYTKFDNETRVVDFLLAAQDQMSGCRKNDIYAYSDLVHDLGLQADTMFAWHGTLFADEQLCGRPMRTVRLCNSTLDAHIYLKAFILDNRYHVKAEYNSNEYSEDLVRQFLLSYEAVVKGLLSQPLIRDIDIASDEQKKLLDQFNQTNVAFDDKQTIVSLFRQQVARTPDNIAVVYKDQQYTYRQVDALSERIAAFVAANGLGTGDVVSVIIPRCEWMAIASLGVLKAGCAYQPLDPTYPKERLNFMIQDAGAKLLIADEELRPIVSDYTGPVLLTKEINGLPEAAKPVNAAISPDDLFILLYTSGSTGVPKGCQLIHRNLVAFCSWYHRYYDLQPCHKVAAYASYGFDACMMDLYPALTAGAAVHIVPEELRLDLVALNDYFEANAITHAFMTTQVAYQFATSIENHSLLHLSTGGEKLATLTPPAGYTLHNGYGPTECTIFTTTFPVDRKRKEIPIGKPLDNLRLYIVDPQGHRLPIGASGELWVSGPQVSRGYLNRPEKTAEVYINNPFDRQPGFERIYRTGDIVRYLPDGNIQFVGRRDGQVKIRGFRIELKEVEAVIREFPGIKDATVQAFDAQGEGAGKFIAAYIVSDQQIDIEALNAFILDQKPPYMVPAVTMQIDAIPLNQNQKVNKKALPLPELKPTAVEEVSAPMNVLEQELHAMIADIVNNTDFGITTVLGYAGLTSISAIKLAVQVNKRYGITLNPKQLIKTGTLQTIENEILEHMLSGEIATAAPERSVTEQATSAPLSYAQTGVYFECMKDPTSTIYNIPYLLTFPAAVTTDRLVEAVKKAVEAHAEMNAHFTVEGDTILQTISDSAPVAIPVTEMTEKELVSHKQSFVQPFNLQKAPLYRFEVVKTEKAVHLLIDVHHLIFDGGSADLFVRQICRALEGAGIDKEKYTYLDFSADQQKTEAAGGLEDAEKFFAEKLQACEGASEIPSDMPKTDEQGFIGEAVCMPDYDKATAFCRKNDITPAHLFLAATAYVVSRHVNNRDIFLCTVSSGRSNLKIADTVGMFVNTLALGLNIPEGSVREYLQAVGNTFDETLQHEEYPFARIASAYSFRPAIAYAYQVGVLSDWTVNGEAVGQELLELNVPKFKINIKIEDRGVVVQYDDAVYSPALAQSLAESIVAVANRMTENADAKIRQLSIVSEAQEQQLSQLRETATGDAPFRFMHECIAHFAAKQPDNQALVATDAAFTYREMNETTDRIAAALRAKGVQERDRVALLLPRTSRLILSLFGVLKSGAAYIPCDPDYPADRVKLILEDSEARFIITTADRLASVPDGKGIDVEELINSKAAKVETNITPDDLAYLIYTSGSTGRPKGVMLRHEGICNYLYGHPANVFANAVLTDADRILSVTTISFDAALQDIGMAYYNGKTLILATEEQANNPLVLADLIKQQRINMVSGTPSRWQTWLTSDDFCQAIANIKICRAGGEKFSDSLLDKMRSVTKARIFNCYGPTEITVASNNKELTNATLVTVGKPQLNVKEFIVDADGNELPVGVVGELYIGGRGVGRGYNNLDEMTRERFVDYHGVRIYKSGDYAKWLADGDVLVLGRTDNQIKLRGLRIELGEIENVMLRVEGMKKVVILIRKISGKEHLCAYYSADHVIAPDALKAEIAKSLTQYMVPTAYMQMTDWPMTPNGKTDVRKLPEPVLAIAGEYEAPANETEATFCDIFAKVLEMDKVGANDNFFEVGGTSLVVMQVIIEAEKAGIHVAYGDVFANPTPRALAHLVKGDDEENTGNSCVTNYDYSAINQLLKENTLDNFRKGERRQLGKVLLTGATGYLGIHILRELIDSDAETIYCLVRGKTLDKAESRLRSLLYYYFADAFKPLFGSRIQIVLGDVTAPFGEDLEIDTVFNCAAIVKHFSEGTEIEDVNIGGAERCVKLCLAKGARLVHVSTASTRGMWAGEIHSDVFTEQRLYMGQFLGNKYIFSKFMAERKILEAVANEGLDAKIMRVGNLSARSTDGEFQANFSTNSFMGRIKIYNMLGCCPYAMRNKRVEFSPINEVSHAIVLLATTPKQCVVFHPYNIHGQFLGDVLTGLAKVGNGIRFVETEEFNEAMEKAKADPHKAQLMTSLLAYQDMAHGQKTADVERDNDYTTQVLYRLGYAFSPTSWDYVERMLTAISAFGFFE